MDLQTLLVSKLNYWIFVILMIVGIWAIMSKNNLIKKIMGLAIFQAAVILFYVSLASKEHGTDIPIYPHDLIHPEHHGEVDHHVGEDSTKAHGAYEKHETAHHEKEHAKHSDDHDTHAEKDAHHDTHGGHQEADHDVAHHDGHAPIADSINADDFNNPLPHVLMLTAIVVGVATLGVGLSLIQRVYRIYGSIEENEILEAIQNASDDGLTLQPEEEAVAQQE